MSSRRTGQRRQTVHALHLWQHGKAQGHRPHTGGVPAVCLSYTTGALNPSPTEAAADNRMLFRVLIAPLQFAFDYHPESEVFACVADIGWITGHSYVVYGPLCNGGTTVLFESIPTFPNPGKNKLHIEKKMFLGRVGVSILQHF